MQRQPSQTTVASPDANESQSLERLSSATAFAISVIMANYNGERWIAEAIRSVQAQSFEDWELIVVDDASTDASVEIVRTLASQDRRIVLLTSPRNAGPAAARNLALERVRGRWVTFLDSDDSYAEQRLDSLMAKAASDQRGIVADDLLIMDEGGTLTGHSLLGVEAVRSVDAIELMKKPVLAYLKPMIATRLLAGIRYDEHLRSGEDLDLLLRVLAKHDSSMSVFPVMGYNYRRRGGSLSTDRSAERKTLASMLDANQRFQASYAFSEKLSAVCAWRHRSLSASLHWVDVTEAIRQRRFTAALRHVADHPRVLGCAVQFFKKRIDRFVPGNKRRAKTLGL